MNKILIPIALSLFFCSTVAAFQGGGGESTKNPKPTPKPSPQSTSKPKVDPPRRSSTPTPTLAYKALYVAVKKKDSEDIKKVLSKGTLEMMETYATMHKKTLNEVLENGLTETTFSPRLPATRNERIWGYVAILEVKNEKSGAWDGLPFVKEDGNWKLAIDTFFKGTMGPSGPTNPDNPGQLPSNAPPAVP